jgi:hypothetical protein
MAKAVRKSITIPGILASAVEQRYREFGYGGFSPYGVELTCYDVRTGSPHTITLQIAEDTLAAQDAVDRELVRLYNPGTPKTGLLVQFVERLHEVRQAADISRRGARQPPLKAKAERITFSAKIWPLIDLRWRELAYASLSAYITGLIRYDLMIGGPHMFTGADTYPEIQNALDMETLAVHREGRKTKTFLDYLIERAHGKTFTTEEATAVKEQIALLLRKSVLVD